MSNGERSQFSNLVWLHCDLQLRGKVIVRHGKRKEVAVGEKWVFCPLQHFPRDRISIKACEKCSHFKRYSKIKENLGLVTNQYMGKKLKWKPAEGKSEKRKKIILTGEDVEAAIKKTVEEQRKWKEEEKKINGSFIDRVR